jgi:STE24 endopeptidase
MMKLCVDNGAGGAKPMETSPRAKEYHRRKLALRISSFVVDFVLLLALVLTPLSFMLAEASGLATSYFALQVIVYVVLLMLLSDAVSLPLAWTGGYHLERAYGLSNQSFSSWAKDHFKALALNILLTVLFAEIFYAFLFLGGEWWWAWAALAFSLIIVILARLAPVLIFPLFFKFKPIENPDLLQRLQSLANKSGAKVTGIYEMDLSRKSNTVNAALAGIGRSRRIILADTLLARFPQDEIEVVVAHELGHHLHNHLLKGIVIQTAATFAFMWLIDLMAGRIAVELGYRGWSRTLVVLRNNTEQAPLGATHSAPFCATMGRTYGASALNTAELPMCGS